MLEKKFHILFQKLQVEIFLLGAINNRDHEQIWKGAPNIEIKWWILYKKIGCVTNIWHTWYLYIRWKMIIIHNLNHINLIEAWVLYVDLICKYEVMLDVIWPNNHCKGHQLDYLFNNYICGYFELNPKRCLHEMHCSY